MDGWRQGDVNSQSSSSMQQPAACSWLNEETWKKPKDKNTSTTRRRRLHFRGYLLIWANQQPVAFVLQIRVSCSALHRTNSSKPGFLFVNTHTRPIILCVSKVYKHWGKILKSVWSNKEIKSSLYNFLFEFHKRIKFLWSQNNYFQSCIFDHLTPKLLRDLSLEFINGWIHVLDWSLEEKCCPKIKLSHANKTNISNNITSIIISYMNTIKTCVNKLLPARICANR